ncbi:hypothetical protein [Flavobacterium terrae]|uniref:Uncharacterized protein n=1 Tax=Flavobacterium terrae TaxID=415425 RepID=A0A1M6AZ02_9FLAO|nr:hypothetical protein [Flavobacterium terrae]SHI41463.1 hypothetical protein SAMN05444363_0467 [Flavobacterium terrae]
MKPNKTIVLRIIGLTLTTLPLVITNQNLSDVTKGLISGVGIGFLILSLIIKPKAKRLI